MSDTETEAPADGRAELDEDGRYRPRFLLDFPRDDRLEPLIDAFCRGNYAYVREHALRVAEETEGDVGRAARELRRRIDPAPVATWLYVGALLFVAFLVMWTYLLPH